MRDYRLYLKDILAAMESIEAFVAGMDFEAFRADDKTASAVVRKFEIIGEAAKGVPEEVRAKVSSDALEGNGGDEGQADSLLLWGRLPTGLDHDQRTPSSG